jgi:Zn-dependent peptidase ImmA (M78 family)
MKEEAILQELETLAQKMSIQVLYDKFYGTGGLCTVNQQKKIIINKDLPIEKKNELLLHELSRFNLDDVYLSPLVRQLLHGEK